MKKINTKKINKILDKIERGEELKRSERIFHQNLNGTLSSKVIFEYTHKEMVEFSKCCSNIFYFIDNYTNIELRSYQKEMINNYFDNKFNIFNTSRQIGFSTIISLIHLWEMLFNYDMRIITLHDKGLMGVDLINKIKRYYIELPYFLKSPIRTWNSNLLKFSNGSLIKSKIASKTATIGSNYDIIELHEYSLYPENLKKLLIKQILPSQKSIKHAKLNIHGFPNKVNDHYHNLFTNSNRKENDPLKNEFNPMSVYWWEVDGRDMEWRENMINMIGGKDNFDKEFDLKFI